MTHNILNGSFILIKYIDTSSYLMTWQEERCRERVLWEMVKFYGDETLPTQLSSLDMIWQIITNSALKLINQNGLTLYT